jgi:hypothetical protein
VLNFCKSIVQLGGPDISKYPLRELLAKAYPNMAARDAVYFKNQKFLGKILIDELFPGEGTSD